MRRLKKYLACLMSACMLLGTLEVPVAAAELPEVSTGDAYEAEVVTESQTNDLPAEIDVCVNPLYEDQVSQETLAQWAAEAEKNAQTAALTEAMSSESLTYEDARAAVLKGMVAREATVTVSTTIEGQPDWEAITAHSRQLIYDAYADDPTAAGNEGDYVRYHFHGWSTSMSRSVSANITYVTYAYTFYYLSTAAQEQAVTEKLAEVYAELNLGVTSDEGRIGVIYDYITNHVTYDYEHLEMGADEYPTAWTAYGALVDGTSVCQGYATLTYRMMKESGVPVRIISGIGNGGAHAWNIVAIDGLYYNIDSTWDGYTVNDDGSVDTAGQRNWYLLSMADFGSHTRDDEYLTSEFQAAHPMAAESYGDATGNPDEMLDVDNLSYTFNAADGGTVSSTASDGQCVLLVFGSTDCGNTQSYINSLISSGIVNNSRVRSIFIDTKKHTQAEVLTFQQSLNYGNMKFCYDTGGDANNAMWYYFWAVYGSSATFRQYPLVVLIDSDNVIRYMGVTVLTCADAKDYLGKLLNYESPTINNTLASIDGITLTWSGIEDAESYNVYFRRVSGAEFIKIANTENLTYTDAVTSQGNYTYAVAAQFSGIEGPMSDAVDVNYQRGAVKEVTLSQESTSLFSYETATLAATVTPVMTGDTVDQSVTWKSSDESVATVADGKITGVKPGAATITATSTKDSTKQATCAVTVKKDYTITYELNGGKLETANPTAYNPYYPTLVLNAPVKEGYGFVGWYRDANFAEDTHMENIPAGSDYGNITLYAKWFECAAPVISGAEVSLEGVKLTWSALDQADKYYVYRKDSVEGTYVKLGQTTETSYMDKLTEAGTYYYALTAEYDGVESGFSQAKEVEYTRGAVKEVTLNQTEVSLFGYQEVTLTATVTPLMEGDTVEQSVTWKSSDESIATVADGKITGVKPGTATITAISVKDTTKQATCIVTVKDDYTITYELNGGKLETANPTAYNPYYPDLTLNAPVKTDCAFLGWYRDAGFAEDTRMENIPAGSDFGNLTLYAKWKEKSAVVAPVANIPSGEVEKGTKIKLSSETLDAVIYYTVDGTNPDRNSKQYTDTITIDSAMEIRAFAVKDGYKDSEIAVFNYTVKDTSADLGDVLPEDVPENGIIPEGLWVAGVDDAVYTGKAITFDLHVYHGKKMLTLKTDYTVSYKNNKAAAEANAKKAPTVTVTGKGNYKEKVVKTFTIAPLSIQGTEFTPDAVAKAYNGKAQKPVPVLYRNGKKLKAKSEYKVSYPDTSEGAYVEPGTYEIILEGCGNYCERVKTSVTITNVTLMSKTKIDKIAAQPYTGQEIKPEIVVKDGKNIVDSSMYDVFYQNNTEVGTATVRVVGKGDNYAGVKTATFKITGVAMSKVKVEGLAKSLPYTGKEVTQDAVKLTHTAKKGETATELVEGLDYTVEYSKNVNVGTATMTFKGMGKYTGSIKKTFKITAFDVKANQGGLLTVDYEKSVPYAKGGAKPAITVTFDGTELAAGKDYTVSYKNNKALNDGSNSKKLATIVVKGKGNFKGSDNYTFNITKQDIALMDVQVADKVASKKANAYKSTPKVYDKDGKALKAGTDYEKAVVYRYDEDTYLADGSFRVAGEVIGSKDVLLAGTVVRVEITGKGNYGANVVCGRYRIVSADVSKAKIKVDTQVYTGKAVEPTKDQIHITLKGKELTAADFEIVSYSNNVKKGTAKMVIRGVGEYGGTKTVKFTIAAKTVKDAEFLSMVLE